MGVNCGRYKMYSTNLSKLLRLFNVRIPDTTTRRILLPPGQCRLYGKYSGYGRSIGVWIKEHRLQVARACTKQLEFIIEQRIRRSLQLFHLYAKIWNDFALKEFIKSWRHRLGYNCKGYLLSAIGVTMFNWDKERITDDELYSYSKEIEIIHNLRDSTVVCRDCQLRLVIDSKQADVNYCKCQGNKSSYVSTNNEQWKPFIERQDMIVWRKEEPNSGGLYAYKVYGSFSDVSAEEFLKVQVDVDYRKIWDVTAQELEIIDTDPMSISAEDHRTDVIYWEMVWPRLFSNRDYVYQRRWDVDKEKGIVVIVSRVVDHPNAPNRPDTYRVTSYWSYMVIKPSTNFNEPGIEFGLTYFDDPGVNIPSAVTTWVAMTGLPEFLCRMRQAAKEYKNYISSNLKLDEKLISSPVTSDNDEAKEAIANHQNSNLNEEQSIETRSNEKQEEVIISSQEINDENSNNESEDIINDKELQSDQLEKKQHGFLSMNDENRSDFILTKKTDRFVPNSET